MQVTQALDDDELDLVLSCLKELKWVDGKGSAIGSAKEKKQNFQAYQGQPEFKPIEDLVDDIIFKRFKSLLFPAKVVGLRAAVYSSENADQYDWHVDYSHMEGVRTDLSFTLFISDKSKYEGGELDIESKGLNFAIKGKSGEIVFYNTGDRHRVRPVTKGTRLVVVGWISSLVSNPEHRAVLTSIGSLVHRIDSLEGENVKEIKNELNENYFRLMRFLSA